MSEREINVLIAGVFHESHSFLDQNTTLSDFTVYQGEDILARRGDGSLLDGFYSVATRRRWQIVPGPYYEAMPSGTVDHSVFEQFCSELEPILVAANQEGLDGILLTLHGAMVTTQLMDPEGELLRRIRSTLHGRHVPVFVISDLHGNLSAAMGKHADALVCYHENPHTDAFERAEATAELLARTLETGHCPRTYVRSAPVVWPPTGTATAAHPMQALEALARRFEREYQEVWAVSVWAGYSFADVPDAGVAFSVVTTGTETDADALLAQLVKTAWALRESGIPHEWDVDEVLQQLPETGEGPVLLVEPADNIGGGAPGDCTEVLRALIRHDVQGAGVILADREAVEALQRIPLGGHAPLPLGGKGSALDPGPVMLDVELISRSSGRFTLEDRHSHLASMFGVHVDMGPSAVVRHRGITLLLTSRKMPPFDLAQWRSQGIDPASFRVIAIKAAVGHRRAYEPIAAGEYIVRTRGPCTSDLRLLPYQHVRRPIFPLDALPWS